MFSACHTRDWREKEFFHRDALEARICDSEVRLEVGTRETTWRYFWRCARVRSEMV